MRCKKCGDKMQNVVYNVTVASKDKGRETILRKEMNEYYVCKCGEVINEPKKTVIYVSNEAMAELVRSQVGSDVVVVVDPLQ